MQTYADVKWSKLGRVFAPRAPKYGLGETEWLEERGEDALYFGARGR
jgi:hypothetical protein